MAKRFRRRRYVRHIPAIVGIAALVCGFSALELSAASKTSAAKDAQLAAASRSADGAASRGAARADDVSTTSSTDSTTSTTEAPTTTVPPTTLPPTTAPPTTAKPVTTTTKAPLPPAPKPVTATNSQTGGASYYSYKAGGCAHRTLPKGTVVTVKNLSSGKTATCVVNDRGPFVAGRIIDLDTSVFRQIANTSAGVVQVQISW
jgi:rare lipoprotein A (peptidoglycan hydrolase)